MQNQMISIRRSVERKVPGYVKVIAFLLYALRAAFTILGAMFRHPLSAGSRLFGGWYLMGEARVIYEYRLDGKTLTVMRTSGMRSRQKEIEFFYAEIENELSVVADEGTESMQDAERLTQTGEKKRVCYDVSAQDPNRACAFLYAKGSGADSGRFVGVLLLPVSGSCGRNPYAFPGKVMMTDGEI
ncbi:MAG: hypothetical protein V8Q79_08635 [Christensenellales bacterium]